MEKLLEDLRSVPEGWYWDVPAPRWWQWWRPKRGFLVAHVNEARPPFVQFTFDGGPGGPALERLQVYEDDLVYGRGYVTWWGYWSLQLGDLREPNSGNGPALKRLAIQLANRALRAVEATDGNKVTDSIGEVASSWWLLSQHAERAAALLNKGHEAGGDP